MKKITIRDHAACDAYRVLRNLRRSVDINYAQRDGFHQCTESRICATRWRVFFHRDHSFGKTILAGRSASPLLGRKAVCIGHDSTLPLDASQISVASLHGGVIGRSPQWGCCLPACERGSSFVRWLDKSGIWGSTSCNAHVIRVTA